LEFQTDAEDISLYYDPVRLEEVFSNLLSNAIKFTPAGGKITMAVQVKKALSGMEGTEAQDFVEVVVSDTGPGIPREALAHIFDRFYQADSTYEYHRQGTGIGLAIAKEIIELHHGKIEAISQQDQGMGARFVIRLPMGKVHLKSVEIVESVPAPKQLGVPGPVAPAAKEDEEEEFERAVKEEEIVKGPEAPGKNIILVVEDSSDVREYIRGALEPLYAVVEAKDGEQGLEKAGEENILTGFETGAEDYITKPFSTRILSARIKNLIDIRSRLQENLDREMTLKPVKTAVSKIDREFLKDLQAVINENISDPDFNVDSLCKKLCMSHSNLFRKVEALSGETPTSLSGHTGSSGGRNC